MINESLREENFKGTRRVAFEKIYLQICLDTSVSKLLFHGATPKTIFSYHEESPRVRS